MKKRLYISVVFLTVLSLSYAQKEDYRWVLGYDIDIFEASPSLGLIEMSFDQDSFSITENETGLLIDLTTANICNKDGELLFYTNGMEVAGSEHEIIENGIGLNPGYASDQWTLLGVPLGYRIQQGAIILPDPGKLNEYYIFHLWLRGYSDGTLGMVEKLLYSKVSVDPITKKGIVEEKNIKVYEEESLFLGHLTAVRHGNGRDWWVMIKGHSNDKYISFLVSPEGISDSNIQNIGIASRDNAYDGQAVFSPTGDKYFHFSSANGVFIMDFDRCSGALSNFEHFPSPKPDDLGGRGMAISPNGRFLYLSFVDEIYQMDLNAPDISASAVLLDVGDGENPGPRCFWATFNQMQPTPNGEIFMSATNTAGFLHVIKEPNKKGLECDFRQRGIELPSCNNFGLPNFPNFRLFDFPNSLCDTLGINGTSITVDKEFNIIPDLKIFPNPASSTLILKASDAQKIRKFSLFSLSGKLLLEKEILPANEFQLQIESQPSGIYFIQVEVSDGVRILEKIVIQNE